MITKATATAVETILSVTKPGERWRWWQCNFCDTEFAMLSTKLDAAPGACPNCKLHFREWKKLKCGTA